MNIYTELGITEGRDRRGSGQAHRGVLLEEFLTPLGVSQYQLAKAVGVPARRINEIVHGQRRITADTVLLLSRHFGTSERFWLNLQYAEGETGIR
jgi:addiction module HigA family antidote